VIDSAQKLGIAVWLLPKILVWIENLKGRIGSLEAKPSKRPHQVEEKIEERDLKAPFLKYDDLTHQTRPVLCEFRRFPKLYCGGRAGQSPFFLPDASSASNHVTKIKREYPDRAQLIARKAKSAKPPVPQGGYCEICEAPFSELEEHIHSKVHTAKVGLDHLWTKLDSCIGEINKDSDDSDEDFLEAKRSLLAVENSDQ